LAVSEDALLVRLGHTLSEDSGILGVEEQINACKLAVLPMFIIPLACEDVSLSLVGGYKDWTPVAAARLIPPETFAGYRAESACLRVNPVLYPFFGEAAIVLGIIERLKRKPVRLMQLRVFIVDSLFMNII
jgi:hypothetical protein